jgi:hypothetical protein
MNITYCNNECIIGKLVREKLLKENNSVFDAAFDFNYFAENCFKSCTYKEAHIKQEEITK